VIDLIPVSFDNFDGEESLSADARCLHKFLESKQQFADWIKSRIEKYGFEEGVDFIRFHNFMKSNKNSNLTDSDKRSIDYTLTINMAKELAMVENNDKGKEVRRYFLRCEKLAKKASIDFIELQSWRRYQDRLNVNGDPVPLGYFGLFRELADILPRLITAGVVISEKIIPDISVGLAWGRYWQENKLAERFGERIKYQHNYPPYYSQSKSNPQEPWAYPLHALGYFRKWLEDTYLRESFPRYLASKNIDKEMAQKAVLTFNPQAR